MLVSCSKEDSTSTGTKETSVEGFPVSNNKRNRKFCYWFVVWCRFQKYGCRIGMWKDLNHQLNPSPISFLFECKNIQTRRNYCCQRAIASPGKPVIPIGYCKHWEDANRTKYNSADQIAVWAFFVDGESASNNENGVILGTAYRNTSFVIYEETIQGLSGGPLNLVQV
jgi:hypothetical protein